MAKVYKDPQTGDILNRSEQISWMLQTSVIRTWWFLLLFTLITIACVLTFNLNVIGWWNVLASYLAIFVEAIVGRAMFGQTRRDALIIRELRTLIKENKQILKEIKSMNSTDLEHAKMDYVVDLDSNKMLEEILEILRSK